MGNKKRNHHKMLNPQATPFAMSGSSHPPYSHPATLASHSTTTGNSTPISTLSAPSSKTKWSTITPLAAHLEKLRLLCHSQKELKKQGYVLKPLDEAEIEAKLRCVKCGKRAKRKPSKSDIRPIESPENELFCDEAAGGCGKSGHLPDGCWKTHPELAPARIRASINRSTLTGKVDIHTSTLLCRKCGERGHLLDRCDKLHPSLRSTVEEDSKDRINANSHDKNHNEEIVMKDTPSNTAPNAPKKKKKRSQACRYHTGHVREMRFSCCQRHVSEEGCVEDEEHELSSTVDATLREYWLYHKTFDSIHVDESSLPMDADRRTARVLIPPPTRDPLHIKGPLHPWPTLNTLQSPLLYSPPSRFHKAPPSSQHRHAIALDCEMGISKGSESELIRLTAVDFFTGQILIDNLVYPSVPMANWSTRYSGVSASNMHTAVRKGTAIHGRDKARMGLLQFVGPETVIVVHGGSGDFQALRWIHTHVIDTFILESYVGHEGGKQAACEKTTEGKSEGGGGRSLKDLCKRKLGIDVQTKGKQGHDSYEDAMGARELVVDWMRTIPDA